MILIILSTFTYDSLKFGYGTKKIFNCKNVKWIMMISRMFNEVVEFICCLIDFFCLIIICSISLQISKVINSMKDLIDYSRETGTGPMGKFDGFLIGLLF